MEESVTYQAIIGKGLLQGIPQGQRWFLLLQGTHRFGAPTAEALKKLNAITDSTRLDELALRLLRVGSWQELLKMPGDGSLS